MPKTRSTTWMALPFWAEGLLLNGRRGADVLEAVQAVPVVVQAEESPMLASAVVLRDIGRVIVRNHQASAAAGEAEMVAVEAEMVVVVVEVEAEMVAAEMVEVEAEMAEAGEDLLLLAGADPLPPVLAPGLRVGGADLPGRPIEGPRGEIGPHRHRRRGTSPRRETGPQAPARDRAADPIRDPARMRIGRAQVHRQ